MASDLARLDGTNAAQVAQALGFKEMVTKTGYLTKRAKQSARNWKKRYFVLSGHSITYYESHKNLVSAKGNFLLTNGTTVDVVDDQSYPYCFEISSEFESMRVAAKDLQEANDWVTATRTTIDEISASTRAYLDILESGMFGSRWHRRFFMLHASSITYHQDHMHTFKALGTIRLTAGTTVATDGKAIFIQEEGRGTKDYSIRPSQAEDDPTAVLLQWKAAIDKVIKSATEASEEAVRPGEANNEQTVADGYLRTQVSKQKWVPRFFALTTSALYMAEDENAADAIAVYPLNPACSVFETNLKPNAFELVTTQQALHMEGADAQDTQRWINHMRTIISQSTVSRSDPLLGGALRKQLDKYDVHFETKKPLGIVLERSREWALVKLSNAEASEVTEGSALCAINGQSVTLKPYNHAIKLLTGWKPPLSLTFIRGPEREGWLGKMSRGRRRQVKNWKQRYFILKQGKLAYYSMETDTPELKGCVQLMGSAVSLVPNDDVGQNFCFRLVSGVATLVMQAETVEEMMEWSTELYHAIAIANGGGYLLEFERKHEAAEAAQADQDVQWETAPAHNVETEPRATEAVGEQGSVLAEVDAVENADTVQEADAQSEAEDGDSSQPAEEQTDAQEDGEAFVRDDEGETDGVPSSADMEADESGEAVLQDANSGNEQVDESQASEVSEVDRTAEDVVVKETRAPIAMPGEGHVRTSSQPDAGSSVSSQDPHAGAAASEDETEGDDRGADVDFNVDVDSDEEEEGDEQVEPERDSDVPEGDTPAGSEAALAPGFNDRDPTPEEIQNAFNILDSMGTGILNPMQFSNLLRASGVSMHNLHLEMQWYTKFDLDGEVGISVSDIRDGLAVMRADKTVQQKLISQLSNYIKDLGSSKAENFSL